MRAKWTGGAASETKVEAKPADDDFDPFADEMDEVSYFCISNSNIKLDRKRKNRWSG